MSKGDNRRQHPRAPIELRVEYKKVNTFFYDYTRNISKGGTFIKTPKPLPEGTEFIFLLVVPHLERPLRLRGVVRWIGDQPDPPRPRAKPTSGMGIEFVYEDDAERDSINKIVERLMIDQLGELAYTNLMGDG
ncbi:MAG: pilus assembly protein PilZ [Proteobacteria bacterium]|nr:MAG: pilus assembly protein PilZ [Pseudomonadota bacterium]PIE17172.1 MAG: pilus assembly protein PilZ [Pseudomonadota bacterium]